VLRNKGRDADTEVDVEAVVDFPGRAPRDTVSPILGCGGSGSSRICVRTLLLVVLGERKQLDFFGSSGLNNTININTGHVNRVGRQSADGAGKVDYESGSGETTS
jgi:hypothetical protein